MRWLHRTPKRLADRRAKIGAMIRAVIFDFDGVIAESVNVKTDAFARLFEPEGPEIVERVLEHHLANGGVSRFDKFRFYYKEFLARPLSEPELDSLCGQFSHLVVEAVIDAPWVPGAQETLQYLQGSWLPAFHRFRHPSRGDASYC